MASPKDRPPRPKPGPSKTAPADERRRLSRIVHDHKGTASVQWYDAPIGTERQVFEIEGQTTTAKRLNAGALSIQTEDTHDPYRRIPESNRKRAPGQKSDLRKLSAWIKMMRELEEAKKRDDGNGGEED